MKYIVIIGLIMLLVGTILQIVIDGFLAYILSWIYDIPYIIHGIFIFFLYFGVNGWLYENNRKKPISVIHILMFIIILLTGIFRLYNWYFVLLIFSPCIFVPLFAYLFHIVHPIHKVR